MPPKNYIYDVCTENVESTETIHPKHDKNWLDERLIAKEGRKKEYIYIFNDRAIKGSAIKEK